MNVLTLRNFAFLLLFALTITTVNAQTDVQNEKVILIEQKGDSLYCSEKVLYFEQIHYEFDSCNYYNNRVQVTFQLQNHTNETLFLFPKYISWYDSSHLRESGGNPLILKPDQSGSITLETIPFSKRKMNSFGELTIRRQAAEPLIITMRFKYESSSVKTCE